MRILNKTMATGLFSAFVSLTPATKAIAQDPSWISAIERSEHVSYAQAKVIYRAREAKKDSIALSYGFVTPPAGAKLIEKDTEKAIYQIPNKTFSDFFRKSEQLKNTLNAEKTIIRIPKLTERDDPSTLKDLIPHCSFRSKHKPVTEVVNGVKSTFKHTNFMKEGSNFAVDTTEMINPDKTRNQVVMYTKYKSNIEDFDVRVAKIEKFDAQGQSAGVFYKSFDKETGNVEVIDKFDFVGSKIEMIRPYSSIYGYKPSENAERNDYLLQLARRP